MVRAGLVALICGLCGPAMALDLSLLRSFPMDGPSGLAYDRTLCGLWVANETSTLRMTDLFGNEVRRFETPLSRVDAVAIEGDHLIISDGAGVYQRIDRQGTALGPAFRLKFRLHDTDGLYVDQLTNEFWVADDTAAQVVRITEDGTFRARVAGRQQNPPMLEPQGITRDTVHDRLLVVDDADATNSLFEFSPDGDLLSVTSLAFAGGDAEGISVNAAGSQIFIAFDDDGLVAVFDYAPTSPVAPAADLPSACMISAFQFGDPRL